jgi:hypothetical protein
VILRAKDSSIIMSSGLSIDNELKEELIGATKTWTNFSQRDKRTTLDVGMNVYDMQLPSQPKQPNLKLKTQPKQLLGYLLLAFALYHKTHYGCNLRFP